MIDRPCSRYSALWKVCRWEHRRTYFSQRHAHFSASVQSDHACGWMQHHPATDSRDHLKILLACVCTATEGPHASKKVCLDLAGANTAFSMYGRRILDLTRDANWFTAGCWMTLKNSTELRWFRFLLTKPILACSRNGSRLRISVIKVSGISVSEPVRSITFLFLFGMVYIRCTF